MDLKIDTTNVMCFYTDISVVDIHYHSCYQIVVSTQSTFNSIIEGKRYKYLRGFIIDKYIKHSCEAKHGSFLVYYIESKSFLGKQLKRLLNSEIFIDIESLLSEEILNQLKNDFSKKRMAVSEIKKLSDQLLYNIFGGLVIPVKDEKTDGRIEKAKLFIHDNLHKSITLEKLASHIYLSHDRARHLFLEQIEVPFSQYILWKRIKAVLRGVLNENLTLYEASIQYGFTDQSHFNRFFKRMFGISATLILKNSQFIQFIYPEL